jgi:hypothetical protein
MNTPDFGGSAGPIFWRYNLSRAVIFLWSAGHTLRWYGLSIPWTRYGIGIIVKRRENEHNHTAPADAGEGNREDI